MFQFRMLLVSPFFVSSVCMYDCYHSIRVLCCNARVLARVLVSVTCAALVSLLCQSQTLPPISHQCEISAFGLCAFQNKSIMNLIWIWCEFVCVCVCVCILYHWVCAYPRVCVFVSLSIPVYLEDWWLIFRCIMIFLPGWCAVTWQRRAVPIWPLCVCLCVCGRR